MHSPEDVQKFQWQASNALNAIIFRKAMITGLVLAGLIVLAIFSGGIPKTPIDCGRPVSPNPPRKRNRSPDIWR